MSFQKQSLEKKKGGGQFQIHFQRRYSRVKSIPFIYTGCSRKTAHVLNCHLCGVSEFRQVVMVDPSNALPFFFQLQSVTIMFQPTHIMHLPLKHFFFSKTGQSANCYTESFHSSTDFSIQNNIILT